MRETPFDEGEPLPSKSVAAAMISLTACTRKSPSGPGPARSTTSRRRVLGRSCPQIGLDGGHMAADPRATRASRRPATTKRSACSSWSLSATAVDQDLATGELRHGLPGRPRLPRAGSRASGSSTSGARANLQEILAFKDSAGDGGRGRHRRRRGRPRPARRSTPRSTEPDLRRARPCPSGWEKGLHVFDISNPQNPDLVASGAHPLRLAHRDRRAGSGQQPAVGLQHAVLLAGQLPPSTRRPPASRSSRSR